MMRFSYLKEMLAEELDGLKFEDIINGKHPELFQDDDDEKEK
jgi:hypothetical protein